MSMLTPPGMGGQYRIKGNRYPRMRRNRRRRRIVLTAASIALLGLLGWGTVQLIGVFSGDDAADRQAAARHQAACAKKRQATAAKDRATAKPLPKPSSITVNVLNATTRKGLAGRTAAELKKRGFHVGKVGNAPAAYDKKVAGAGLLLGSAAARDGALKVLGAQLAAGETRTDDRKGGAVDLIIGKGFDGLTTRSQAQDKVEALAAPSPRAVRDC